MPLNESVMQRLLDLKSSEVIPVYEAALALVQDVHQRATRDEPPDLRGCRPVAERLVAGVAEQPMDFMWLAMRPKGHLTFLEAHPVNVTIILLELLRGWSECPVAAADVALLGLLHDIGIVKVEDLVRQPRRLTADERATLERHVTATHALLSQVTELSPEVVAAATQDHERLDGSGYPEQRRRGQIHRLAQFLAIADIFEAMTHDRPYQPARAPYVVLRELLSTSGGVLETDFLKLLVFRLGMYPVGSWVELSTREIARVTEARQHAPLRPLVQVISDSSRRLLPKGRALDLSAVSGVAVTRWLDEETVRQYL